MADKIDFFHLRTGRKLSDLPKPPTLEQTVHKRLKGLKSNYPLRSLGVGVDGELFVSEEERDANFHIIGAPKQGKSKFLEYNIRKDIDMGNGLVLIDPSDFGATCKAVLDYCAFVGHRKVVIIDPSHQKLATIQTLNKKAVKQSLNGIMEVASILFGAKETETPRIKRYLAALIRVITKAGFTLYESRYFSDYHASIDQQLAILHKVNPADRDMLTLGTAFKTEHAWENYFGSTINRLDSFWEEPLSLMTGADTGIDFVKMIAEGWVILVNLFPDGRHLSETESQLLGVLIINQIIQAVDTLKANDWNGVYYMYIDEAGRFATPQIDTLLSYKRKSGLRVILAHHYFSQFKDKQVLQSVKQNTGIKVMFDVREHEDRMEMIKSLGYGGEISHAQATYANQDLPKQYAIIKKGKEPPQRVKIPDVPEVKISQEQREAYINQLQEQPWYLDRQTIEKQIIKRVIINDRTIREDTESPELGKMDDPKTTGEASVSRPIRGELEKGVRPDNKKSPEPPAKRPIKI